MDNAVSEIITKAGTDQAAADPVQNLGPDLADFRDEVWLGLGQAQKTLPSKFFYDELGSKLFDEITQLDQYYPTRTETKLLGTHAGAIASFMGTGATLVEFGAGSLIKIRILLEAMDRPQAFVPIDISKEHLILSADQLALEFPHIQVRPVVADFASALDFGALVADSNSKRIGFFPGSTIGNFAHDAAVTLLATIGEVVGSGGELLIGVDLKKDNKILLDAYNDSQGVTADFNRNLLVRINRELGGNFDLGTFRHHAPYNADEGRIEMHLVSGADQTVNVAGKDFVFTEGETIHTENSYKYGIDEFLALASEAGFDPVQTWTDQDDLFSIHYLRAR
ncbi:MAG: L-histidine N(alpha)-methyltransferase [Alphaproteobacteria bacterium]|jgi:L-histidine Nalpha-methyltransferase|nr:L-histidine N(alpha)-methyltransferase [Alphaproteobacteria bacterium]MBT4710681.1 L-histidine N(alpha)-methyltransferase [Alphaproteobacteria bacterium]